MDRLLQRLWLKFCERVGIIDSNAFYIVIEVSGSFCVTKLRKLRDFFRMVSFPGRSFLRSLSLY